MTATTTQPRQAPAPAATVPLPDITRLTLRQQITADCALCGRRLGTAARHLGIIDDRGLPVPLAACHPGCPPSRPLPRRVPNPRPGRHLNATAPSDATPCDNTPDTLRRVLNGLHRLPTGPP